MRYIAPTINTSFDATAAIQSVGNIPPQPKPIGDLEDTPFGNSTLNAYEADE